MGDATERRGATHPSERAKTSSIPERGGGLSVRLPLPGAAAVDSILLEYLNKPTAPTLEAVRLPVASYTAPPNHSGAPTRPPTEQPSAGEAVSVTGLVNALPEIAEESLEDERPTGQWVVSPIANPHELVRDRGVLVRLDGDASGEVIPLPREPVLVGRSSRAHVHITEPSVSREHAQIVYEYGTYYAVDGGSQNGTLVAGRRIIRAELRDGDLVQFGHRSTYRFSLMDRTQEQVMRRLYESSTRDPLTGADNRRHMESRLGSEIAFAERHKRPLSVILLDIDFFKNVNDRYGHPAGDEVLKSVASVIRGQLRTEDAFARYGGEEFVIVLRDTALPQAALVAERVRDKVGKSPMNIGGDSTLHVTISAGCASLECSAVASIEELVGVADRRLYRAKRIGRNCVVTNDDGAPAAR